MALSLEILQTDPATIAQPSIRNYAKAESRTFFTTVTIAFRFCIAPSAPRRINLPIRGQAMRYAMNGATKKALRAAAAIASLIAIACSAVGPASAGTLDRLRQDKTVRIAYRDDAPPFSFVNSASMPTGFLVDLCQAVAQKLAEQLNLGDIKISYVLVTAANRFEAIENGQADLLCEPTSMTLERREHVDFSIATFIDGAGLLVRAGKPSTLADLAGQKIGVLEGTTTEQSLRNAFKAGGATPDIVPAKTHAEGLAMLDAGTIAAYFADRSILVSLLAESKAPEKLNLADNYLTLEPYALALPRGDDDFRLAVDRALSHIYRSGEIVSLFQRSFGAGAKPTQLLETLYLISGLPD